MFVRFVRLRVREGQEWAFAEWYRTRVIPALSALPACVFAGLLTPWRGDDHLSLTIWRSKGGAGAYERGGLYHELLREAEPMLSPRTEWRVRPGQPESTDAEIREIPTEGFVIDAGDGAAARIGRTIDTAFVRIVSVRVSPDRIGEFIYAYSNRILPTLRAQPGFRGGLLAEDPAGEGACLSITLWDREEDAARYELSGTFAGLTDEVKATFSPVYDWPAALAGPRDGDPRRVALKVATYQLVMGKRLEEGAQ
jgi:heme-degrading monooxygenase HmoA